MIMKFKRVLQVFLTFVKIGLFTFGGGHAMIPLIEREIVDNHGWINKQDVNDVIAVCESVPGSIAVNSATFVGYKVAGFWGALFATLGVIIPSFTIILMLSGICLSMVLYVKNTIPLKKNSRITISVPL